MSNIWLCYIVYQCINLYIMYQCINALCNNLTMFWFDNFCWFFFKFCKDVKYRINYPFHQDWWEGNWCYLWRLHQNQPIDIKVQSTKKLYLMLQETSLNVMIAMYLNFHPNHMHLNLNGLKNDLDWIIFIYVNKCKIKFSLFNVKQVEKWIILAIMKLIEFHKIS